MIILSALASLGGVAVALLGAYTYFLSEMFAPDPTQDGQTSRFETGF